MPWSWNSSATTNATSASAVPEPLIASDGDDAIAVDGDEGQAVHVVDMGETVDLLVRELGVQVEVSEVDGAWGEMLMEPTEAVLVVGEDRSHLHGA